MFEKEAGDRITQQFGTSGKYNTRTRIWQDGAVFGYKLAHEEMDYLNKHWGSEEERKDNEWHYVKDEKDLPTDKKEYLLLLGSGIRTFGFYNGRFWESWKGDFSWQEVKAYYDVPVPNEESLNLKGE